MVLRSAMSCSPYTKLDQQKLFSHILIPAYLATCAAMVPSVGDGKIIRTHHTHGHTNIRDPHRSFGAKLCIVIPILLLSIVKLERKRILLKEYFSSLILQVSTVMTCFAYVQAFFQGFSWVRFFHFCCRED